MIFAAAADITAARIASEGGSVAAMTDYEQAEIIVQGVAEQTGRQIPFATVMAVVNPDYAKIDPLTGEVKDLSGATIDLSLLEEAITGIESPFIDGGGGVGSPDDLLRLLEQ